MMSRKKRAFRYFGQMIVFIIWGSFSTILYSQNCVQTLKKAQIAYDEGRISQVPDILEECLKNGFNKEEKASAYRLLSLTYLYLDEPVKADESILQLLKLNPEYRLNTSVDPAEFVNLYNSYRTRPIFNIGLKGGINLMFIDVKEPITSNGNVYEAIVIKSQTGFQLGASFDVLIRSKLAFGTELLYANKEFRYNYVVSEQRGTYSERLNLIALPLLLKYNFGQSNYTPFIAAGAELCYVTSAPGNTSNDFISPTTDFAPHRRKLLYAAVLGAGIKNKLGPGIITFGIRFMYGLNSIVKKSDIYSNNGTWTLSYGATPSEYNIHTFNFNVGYLIPVYKPKKIK